MTIEKFKNLKIGDEFIYKNDFDGCDTIITIYDVWIQSDCFCIESTSGRVFQYYK